MSKTACRTAAAFLLLAQAAAGQIVIPEGPEFQVHTGADQYQDDPAVAMNDDGSFVVVWTSAVAGLYHPVAVGRTRELFAKLGVHIVKRSTPT